MRMGGTISKWKFRGVVSNKQHFGGENMAIDKIYEYLRSYDRQTYQIVACGDNPPTEKDISDFEAQYNIHLPSDFRKFTMSSLGGFYMEVREEVWPRAQAFEVRSAWSFWYGIIVYGIADDIPDFLDIRMKTEELHDQGFTEYIPFMSVIGDDGNIYCFDEDNNIVLLSYYATGEATQIDGSFEDCLLRQMEELEERKNRKIRDEDKKV